MVTSQRQMHCALASSAAVLGANALVIRQHAQWRCVLVADGKSYDINAW